MRACVRLQYEEIAAPTTTENHQTEAESDKNITQKKTNLPSSLTRAGHRALRHERGLGRHCGEAGLQVLHDNKAADSARREQETRRVVGAPANLNDVE